MATGAGLAAAELAVGTVATADSPVVAVGQKVIDLAPEGPREWAIETFGTSDKTVLVVTTLVILFGVGMAIGATAIAGRLRLAGGATAAVGAVGVVAVLTGTEPSAGKVAPVVVGTLVSLAVLWRVTPPAARRSRPTHGEARHAMAGVGPTDDTSPIEPIAVPGVGAADRRAFLLRSTGVAAVAAISGGVGRLIQGRFRIDDERAALRLPPVAAGSRPAALPPNADLEVDGLSPFVVGNGEFYRIDTALRVPQVSRESWSLRIHGMVGRELELTFDDLLAREQISRYVTLSCVSNPVGGPYVGNALWQGVRLDAILAEAGVDPSATQLVSRSSDGWTCGTPVASVVDGRDSLLAFGMNGEPLPAEHGYPVRMVVPGEYGYVSATKWVVELELTTWEAYDAYWVPRGWAQQAPMKAMTRIETPRHRAAVQAGGFVVAGTAWHVHRGISAVEVRADAGEWQRATLGGVPSADTWRKWSLELDLEPGEHRLEARSTNGFGEVETAERADVVPDGASGYHEVTVDVAAA